MGPLNNARHEAFARALAEGHSITESYERAGYKRNRGNSARLNADERVRARVLELQEVAAKASEITIESICRELDEATAVAKERGQAQAMISASTLRAKLNGLMVERVELTTNDRLDSCGGTAAELADGLLDRLVDGFRPVDERDRQALMDILNKQANEIADFLKAISARPIIGERVDLSALPSDWKSLRLHSARQITNGSK